MSAHTPHELHDEFPQDAAVLHRLKLTNPHFVQLAEKHHVVNREIHRIAAEIDAASDERLEGLKRERLHLLDEIAAMIEAEEAHPSPA
ncbi:MAG: YdcH family protein [Erythrobacter sp.]